jgi:uncharacterized CHY-type Zn-finger protein
LLACTKCGHWHTNAEAALGRSLSCTEVKQFWGRIKAEHRELYGHPAQITIDEEGKPICLQCKRRITCETAPANGDQGLDQGSIQHG